MPNKRTNDVAFRSRWSQFSTELLFELECPKLFDNEKHVLQDIAIFKEQILQKGDEHFILPVLLNYISVEPCSITTNIVFFEKLKI